MPSPSNIKLQVSVNAGGLQTGPIEDGVTVAAGDTISLSAFGASGARSYLYEIYDYPDGMTVPDGWTENTDTGVFYSEVAEPNDWVVPDIWGDYMLRLTINGGNRDGAEAADLIDESIALRILSPGGLRDTAFRTSNQFSVKKQWLDAFKKNWRTLEGAAGAAPDFHYREWVQVDAGETAVLAALDFDALPNVRKRNGVAIVFGAEDERCHGKILVTVIDHSEGSPPADDYCEIEQRVSRADGDSAELVGDPDVSDIGEDFDVGSIVLSDEETGDNEGKICVLYTRTDVELPGLVMIDVRGTLSDTSDAPEEA